jgi:hypothetical protein
MQGTQAVIVRRALPADAIDAHRFFEAAGYDGTAKRGFVKYRRQFKAWA